MPTVSKHKKVGHSPFYLLKKIMFHLPHIVANVQGGPELLEISGMPCRGLGDHRGLSGSGAAAIAATGPPTQVAAGVEVRGPLAHPCSECFEMEHSMAGVAILRALARYATARSHAV